MHHPDNCKYLRSYVDLAGEGHEEYFAICQASQALPDSVGHLLRERLEDNDPREPRSIRKSSSHKWNNDN